ncbi:hypothetical protein ACERJO_18485 [Halalkalibacter sp. AB-rgal2]|uniref:hypothetical protein n=1 Tax=Halalkalibacter sp. AB-rgal2 TaxID=3242695 RepID=UPI00359D822F
MKRRKAWLLLAGAAGTTTLLMRNEEFRSKVRRSYGQLRSYFKDSSVMNKVKDRRIGHSHPHDYDDHNMVEEGAMTSINYYNKAQQKDHQ